MCSQATTTSSGRRTLRCTSADCDQPSMPWGSISKCITLRWVLWAAFLRMFATRLRAGTMLISIPGEHYNLTFNIFFIIGCFLFRREQSYFCKRCAEQEMVARSALWSKNRGLYLEHTSGTLKTSCPKFNGSGINPNWETWSPKQEPGLKLWKPTEASIDAVKQFKIKYSSAHRYMFSLSLSAVNLCIH